MSWAIELLVGAVADKPPRGTFSMADGLPPCNGQTLIDHCRFRDPHRGEIATVPRARSEIGRDVLLVNSSPYRQCERGRGRLESP